MTELQLSKKANMQAPVGLAPGAIRPTPPFPRPHDEKLGVMRLLRALWRNPLEAWARPYFEEAIVVDRSIFGEIATINDPDAIRRVLVDNTENYHKDSLQRRLLGAAMREGMLQVEDRKWRKQRKTLAPAFSRRAVMDFAPAVQQGVNELVARWRRLAPGAIVDVAAEMAGLTLDVLTKTVFADGLGGSRDEVRANMRLYFDSIGQIDALDMLGAPAFIPRIGRLKIRPAEKFFTQAVDRLLAMRREQLERDPAEAAHDLLTLMLAARDPSSETGFSDEEIRANLITFIAAGHETTANALTWSLYLLTLSNEWRNRVTEEAEARSGAAADLPQARAVVEEALRLYPPLVAISRQALGPDELAGQPIRKGALVVIAPYVLHRRAQLWPRPECFDPSRFLPDARAAIPRFAYLPFGAGPRICIGAAFALQEATLALAAIMHEFRLEVAPGCKVWPMQRVTLRPAGGLPMVVRRRMN